MRFPIFLFILCAMAACSTARHDDGYARSASDVRGWIAARLNQGDSVVFLSHNGIPYGPDYDAKIAFEKNGAVEVTMPGPAPVTYNGTWSTDRTGLIKLDLHDYSGKWPGMRLFATGDGAQLFSMEGGGTLITGGGANPSGLAGMNPYWPFRLQ